MSGGMRIDPRELPLPLREQVAEKIVAELAKAGPVAGHQEAKKIMVRVRRLRFRSPQFSRRYIELCRMYNMNLISDLVLRLDNEGYVEYIIYQVTEMV